MPLKDLLWACPLCQRVESIDPKGTCRGCGARFRRTRGARIAATTAAATAGHGEELDAVGWLARLPGGDLDGEGHRLPAGVEPPFEQTVEARTAGAELPLRRGRRFLGAVERFGSAVGGTLRLDLSRVTFTAQSGSTSTAGQGAGVAWDWPLAELTAIQPASSAIQLKARGAPVVSLRFRHGSVRLWEQRLKYCTRAAWRAAGKGEIGEFQPWIRGQ